MAGTTIPLDLKIIKWSDFNFSHYKRGSRKWVESSLKLNIIPVLAKEMLGFDEGGRLLAHKEYEDLDAPDHPEKEGDDKRS